MREARRREGSGVTGFSLMPDCENDDGFTVEVVARGIAAIAEIDEPFPELFRQAFDRTADAGLCAYYLQPLADGLTCTLRGCGVFLLQKRAQPLKIPYCGGGEDHLRHLGAGSSVSEPQLVSH